LNAKRLAICVAAIALVVPLAARAGATLKIDDDIKLELGLRLQTQFVYTEKDRTGDGNFRGQKDFLIRRARIRLRGDATKYVSAFLQTDWEEQGGTSPDMRVIDAYVLLKPHRLAYVYVGENMVPAIREEVSSSASLMAIDRPGLAYKSLTWGARTKFVFTNETFSDSNSLLLRGTRSSVRDLGATLFGNVSLTPMVHFKYYLGVYDGVQLATRDNFRYTGRGQVNFFDAESGYYNDSTYLGTKRTLAFGGSFDAQNAVALDQATGRPVNYRLWSLDAFAEQPVGPGSITAEFGYVNLDLGGGGTLVRADGATPVNLGNASRAQGHGWYAQAGFYVTFLKLQPWVNYEKWTSDASDRRGSYKAYRAGLNYWFWGDTANAKAGIEVFEPDTGFSPTTDKITSFVLALNTNY
jgi:hypothetical protein